MSCLALGFYYITVFGFSAAQFTVTGSIGSTVITLSEGIPARGSLSGHGSYAYFRFLDSDADKDVQFSLQPSSGDADIFVSCLSNPTGDESGIPSVNHFNFSSTR